METVWMEELEASARDAGRWRLVPWRLCREIALREGIPPREVEASALEAGLAPDRYERSLGTLGLSGQAKLLRSRVALIGCGGLGGLIAELMARSAVGELVLVDGDTFSDNNLNRQVLCDESNLGRSKAEAAAERVSAVNGAVEPRPFAGYLNGDNAEKLLSGCSLAVDALDNQRSRRLLRAACSRLEIPFIHGAVAGFYGQVGVVRPGGPALWDALGEGAPDKGIETETGNPPFTPALIAAWQVAEAVKVLLGIGAPLDRRILWIDLSEGSVQRVAL